MEKIIVILVILAIVVLIGQIVSIVIIIKQKRKIESTEQKQKWDRMRKL